ncbi:IS66-like element accessory protein TnpA [Achromobacter xylosoxidans]|uniref:IS66-like element accessory protein TnpA n=1 Tax=Alcaligenes xylosoxydans xylosoxydans TaxID=85698 RepID=UPI000B48FD2B|nr:transposase [Achromobacter xylosoxidans]
MGTTDQKTPSLRRNRRHSDAFKLELVAQVRQLGMSVARVAREAGVNANQVFAWIKQHRDGTLRATSDAGPTLLAVRVAEPEAVVDAQSPRGPIPLPASVSEAPATVASCSGTLALRLAHAELTIEGSPHPEVLETVLRWLTR